MDDDSDTCIEAELQKMFGSIRDSSPKVANFNKNEVISKSKENHKISKNENLRDLLIRLFGSPLDDIEIEKETDSTPVKLNKNRRYSLPISINIDDDDFLTPLKVSRKRMSENDASSGICKVSKLSKLELNKVTVSVVPEFIIASEFVNLEMNIEAITSTTVLSEKTTSADLVVTEPKVMNASETEVVNNNIINLTANSRIIQQIPLPINYNPVLLENGIKIEVLEPSQSSEEANTPTPTFSMPLLSPPTCAETAQSEATLPETSHSVIANRQMGHNNSSQYVQTVNLSRPDISLSSVPQKPVIPPPKVTVMPPPRPSNKNVTQISIENSTLNSVGVSNNRSILQRIMEQFSTQQKHQLQNENPAVQNQISSSGGNYQVQNQLISTPITQSHFNNNQSYSSKSKHLGPPALKQQKVSAAPQSSPQQQYAMSSTTTTTTSMPYLPQKNIPMVASVQRHRISQNPPRPPPPPPPPAYQQSRQKWNQNCPPGLIRLSMATQDGFHLLSNAGFAVKVFPHMYIYTQWRETANNFCQNMKTFLSQGAFKENYDAFTVYAVHTMQTFGKRLIQDLLTVDVHDFSLNEILLLLATKLQEKNVAMNVYRVCMYFSSMIRGCESFCTTPFTHKFYKHVALAMEKMETRLEQGGAVSSFQPLQLKQLEVQIQQYLLIRSWTNAYLSRVTCGINRNNNNAQTTQLNTPSSLKQQQSLIPQRNQDVQKQNYAVPLRRTVLQNQLQIQGNPDRSGKSDNLINKSNFNPTTINTAIPDKYTNFPQKTISETYRRPLCQVNENIACGNIPQNSEISSSVPSLGNSSSLRESSVPEVNSKGSLPAGNHDGKTAIANCISATEIIDLCEDLPVMKRENNVTQNKAVNVNSEEIIDLTWIDDGDEAAMMEEITNHREFPFKVESDTDTSNREVVSPADSGLGSPRSQADNTDVFKCLCGEKAIYVCACNSSMYCSRECQICDWADHQRWCQEMKT